MKNKTATVVLVLIIATLFVGGCTRSTAVTEEQQSIVTDPLENKTIIDVSNNQDVTVSTGEVIHVTLNGEYDSNKQWSIVSPTNTDNITLIDHKKRDEVALGGENKYADEWWFSVNAKGQFDLKFEYAEAGKEPEETFTASITAQ